MVPRSATGRGSIPPSLDWCSLARVQTGGEKSHKCHVEKLVSAYLFNYLKCRANGQADKCHVEKLVSALYLIIIINF